MAKKKEKSDLKYGMPEASSLESPAELLDRVGTNARTMVDEYRKINQDLSYTQSFDAFLRNPEANCQDALLLLDHSRVKLEDSQNDYYHASYVEGYSHRKQYILAQAPMPDQEGQFWQMVAEQRVNLIVLLVAAEETVGNGPREWWPRSSEQTIEFASGGVVLSCVEKWTAADYYQHRLLLAGSSLKYGQHTTNLIQYKLWTSDHAAVPMDTVGFAAIIYTLSHNKSIVPEHATRQSSPILIVCNNGVTRSGIFVTLCIIHERFIKVGEIEIKETAKLVRFNRYGALQDRDSYYRLYTIITHLAHTFDRTPHSASVLSIEREMAPVIKHHGNAAAQNENAATNMGELLDGNKLAADDGCGGGAPKKMFVFGGRTNFKQPWKSVGGGTSINKALRHTVSGNLLSAVASRTKALTTSPNQQQQNVSPHASERLPSKAPHSTTTAPTTSRRIGRFLRQLSQSATRILSSERLGKKASKEKKTSGGNTKKTLRSGQNSADDLAADNDIFEDCNEPQKETQSKAINRKK